MLLLVLTSPEFNPKPTETCIPPRPFYYFSTKTSSSLRRRLSIKVPSHMQSSHVPPPAKRSTTAAINPLSLIVVVVVVFFFFFDLFMARWVKPEVYPLIAAMTFVSSMCVFQLTRNVFMNPDVRINKNNRMMAVLENAEEGEKYSQHGFRRFLKRCRPEIFDTLHRYPGAGAGADK